MQYLIRNGLFEEIEEIEEDDDADKEVQNNDPTTRHRNSGLSSDTLELDVSENSPAEHDRPSGRTLDFLDQCCDPTFPAPPSDGAANFSDSAEQVATDEEELEQLHPPAGLSSKEKKKWIKRQERLRRNQSKQPPLHAA